MLNNVLTEYETTNYVHMYYHVVKKRRNFRVLYMIIFSLIKLQAKLPFFHKFNLVRHTYYGSNYASYIVSM